MSPLGLGRAGAASSTNGASAGRGSGWRSEAPRVSGTHVMAS